MPEATSIRAGAGLSGHLFAVQAAEQAAQQAAQGLDGRRPDLAFVFFSAHHVEAAGSIVHAIERRLNPGLIVGVSAEAVIGGDQEMEGAPGLSIFAAALPGVGIRAFSVDELPGMKPEAAGAGEMTGGNSAWMPTEDLYGLREAAGLGNGHRATFVFADPFSTPINGLLPALARARALPDRLAAAGIAPSPGSEPTHGPIIGGMASAAQKPGGNVLILNDTIERSGGICISLTGRVRVDTLVSQGCKPIGPTFIVTGVRGQLITGLGGRPAIDALTDMLDTLNDVQKAQAQKRGLFLGRAVTEYKKRFGRDDFLIRNVYGVDQSNGAIAVMDLLKVGQTVQFHLRDQTTATEDLALLLDAQQLHDPPAGVLLFTCNGRGTRLFDHPSHDARTITRAFAPAMAGEDAAKAGFPVTPGSVRTGTSGARPIPLAGFFAAGEIGPLGDDVYVHGQTACVALFREPDAG